jgi:hypothetical protein
MPTLTGWQNLAPTWTLLGPTWTDIFVVTDWTPEPQVTLDGIDYTANTIGNVSIRRGRDTVYAQVQAGYATVELIDVNGLIQPKVGQTLVVSARDAYNVQTPLFTGQVSDWDTETVAVQDGVLVTYRMQAVGPLARLNRRTILTEGRPSELDGARVGAAVAEGLSSAWEEVAGTVTWGSVGTAVTYDTFDPNFDDALIDPGVFTLAALGSADSGYTALQVAQDAASSGQGVMFETAAGLVGYADADRRQDCGTERPVRGAAVRFAVGRRPVRVVPVCGRDEPGDRRL